MSKYKLQSLIVLSVLAAIFTIIGTLAFIPSLEVSANKDVETFKDVHATYANSKYLIATVVLMAIFAFSAIVIYAKSLIKIFKNKQENKNKDQKLFLIFGSITIVLTTVMVIYAAVSFSVLEDNILLLSATKNLIDSNPEEEIKNIFVNSLNMSIKNNEMIKYIILIPLFLLCADYAAMIIYKIAKKTQKTKVEVA
ncbi:hypothetical protein V2E24_01820 [Mycoplasmopsis ciconiae]|uniref:DUF4064 domain-containing protein n=1 Tax=Mycoplasmopsis ciconiae TaxID=561067 RepID=A0ABU7MMM1_9BACT|nr:hypothetical protein [Mycoplasmopsis ciconiae]